MRPERRRDLTLFATLTILYFMQGLPAGLLAKAVPALARQDGVSRAWIGLLALAALPWALKFLWAPWVDRLGHGRPGHRRRWVLVCQSLVIALLLLLSVADRAWWFGAGFPRLLAVLFLINLASATQDIASDGLAVRLLRADQRGPGNSIQVGGYKIGLILSGALFLIGTGVLGWTPTLWLLAGLLIVLLVPLWRYREPPEPPAPVRTRPGGHWWWRQVRGFWARPGLGLWALILFGYKVGDGFGSRMIKPFLVDHGLSLAAIGRLDLAASLVGLAGAGVGGLALRRIGRKRALIGFGLLQGLAFVGWAWCAANNGEGVWPVALFEQFADGLSTVVLFAVMMDYCRPGSEGSDYSLQASLQLMTVGLFMLASGFSAETLGYAGHFLLAAGLTGLVIMAALFWTPFSGPLLTDGDTRHD